MITDQIYEHLYNRSKNSFLNLNYAEIHLDKAYCDINSLIESAVSTVAPSNKITRKKTKAKCYEF